MDEVKEESDTVELFGTKIFYKESTPEDSLLDTFGTNEAEMNAIAADINKRGLRDDSVSKAIVDSIKEGRLSLGQLIVIAAQFFN